MQGGASPTECQSLNFSDSDITKTFLVQKYHIAQTPPKVEINIKNTTKILYTGRIAAAPDGKNCGTQLI